jgi:hypothetical protein
VSCFFLSEGIFSLVKISLLFAQSEVHHRDEETERIDEEVPKASDLLLSELILCCEWHHCFFSHWISPVIWQELRYSHDEHQEHKNYAHSILRDLRNLEIDHPVNEPLNESRKRQDQDCCECTNYREHVVHDNGFHGHL